MTRFGTLDSRGRIINERHVAQSDMVKCDHFIMVPEHYRENGTCRCDDDTHAEMSEWGYTWDDGRWS